LKATNVNDVEDCLFNECITEDELLRAVSSLNCQKSVGGTLVPQHIVHGISVLKPFIFRLFNRLFLCGEFPSNWSISVLIPVFKRGQQHDPKNYRDIALGDVLSKFIYQLLQND